ncbi:MAG: MotA/TolQ/ExbB proton channel family protein [Planctomycetia bacterium]|nr:MotA/TolQ/ExbB proton channel family protein [Planctomycetia bacterium]
MFTDRFLLAITLLAADAPGHGGGMLTKILLRAVSFGAEWVLWVLLILSFVSVGIIVERILFYRSSSVDAGALRESLTESLNSGDIKGAYEQVAESDAIECKVLAAGLAAFGRGSEACSEAMASAKARERGRLDEGLAILGTIGANAPFVGLLGTVLGIVNAAQSLAVENSQSNQQAVLAGVFEALVATAVGLFVAIPAVVAFNMLQRKVRSRLAQTDSLAHFLLSAFRTDK